MLTTENVVRSEYKLAEAIRAGDADCIDKMLHDDLLFITPDGVTVTKKTDIDAHKAGTMVVEQLVLTPETINIIDDAAVSVVRYQAKGKMIGQPIEGSFKYIRIWKQFGDTLKVIGGSCTKM